MRLTGPEMLSLSCTMICRSFAFVTFPGTTIPLLRFLNVNDSVACAERAERSKRLFATSTLVTCTLIADPTGKFDSKSFNNDTSSETSNDRIRPRVLGERLTHKQLSPTLLT